MSYALAPRRSLLTASSARPPRGVVPLLGILVSLGTLLGCSSSSTPGERPTDGSTGSACEEPADCFPNVPEGALEGEAECLDRVDGGYCTHECETDENCCATEEECPNGARQVCSPFESTERKLCFLSCEKEDLEAANDWDQVPKDENEYCQLGAGSAFSCRSSGGGSENRKICVPGDCGVGTGCDGDDDCDGELSCVTNGFPGGYCTLRDCATNDDCPGENVCGMVEGAAVCLRPCGRDSDCSFCRDGVEKGRCAEDVELASGESASVCVPTN